jgi:protein transport protein SEC23
MDFTAIEQNEGVRFVWNNIPTSRLEATRNVIPPSLLFTPFIPRLTPVTRSEARPLTCQSCQWIANKFCLCDYANFRWDCSNCGNKNNLPNQYREFVLAGNQIPEFDPENALLEFKTSQGAPIGWFLVVDTCISPAELEAVKSNLIAKLSVIEGIHIGLITFGKNVYLHDLLSPFLNEILIGGETEYTSDKLRGLLKLKVSEPGTVNAHRFIQPLGQCREKLLKIIRRLKPDGFEPKKDQRKLRSTGQAILVATTALEGFGNASRVTVFQGGPTTSGPGRIISDKLTENFRAHGDLERESDSINQFKKAAAFYDSILEKVVKINVTIDLFAFCLDQFGIAEMRGLIEKSGGIVVNQEEFTCEVFDQSFDKYIINIFNDETPYGANLKVLNSKDFFVSGALGPLKLLKKSADIPTDADNLIGETGGNEFQLGAVLPSSTYLIFFGHKNPEVSGKNKAIFFQMQISYTNKNGERIVRVSTFQRELVSDNKILMDGFDQEAAIACIARLATFKSEKIDVVDLVYWLNSVLIKFVRRFSTFDKDKVENFQIANEISLIPQFMFYFRKSYFVQKFGTSVDESALFKMTLNRESLSNMLVMIQPALFAYDLNSEEPNPVLCDFESLKPDIVLLVDTYFHILIWQGSKVHGWKLQNYHLNPEYEHLGYLFKQPQEDAEIIFEDRLPVPKVITCHQGSPNERILKSKLNPPTAQNSNPNYQLDENYITDDVNLKTFMEFLVKLVVKKD